MLNSRSGQDTDEQMDETLRNAPRSFVGQFLIMATDGVWDVTEIGQAVQIVQVS